MTPNNNNNNNNSELILKNKIAPGAELELAVLLGLG